MKTAKENKLPDPYADPLNTERISKYWSLLEQFDISESTAMHVFCAGLDWYKDIAESHCELLTTEIDRLKKENERARELMKNYRDDLINIIGSSPAQQNRLESIQSFLNESKPQK